MSSSLIRQVSRQLTGVNMRSLLMTTRAVALTAARRVHNSRMTLAAAPAAASADKMFCRQCEQTSEQKGCKVVGVCGKTPEVAALQDLLVFVLGGVAQYQHATAQITGSVDPQAGRFLLGAMFSTLTNVNFDGDAIISLIRQADKFKETSRQQYLEACKKANKTAVEFMDNEPARYYLPSSQSWTQSRLVEIARKVAGLEKNQAAFGPDVAGLMECVLFGIKGTCAYAKHAMELGTEDNAVYAKLMQALATIHASKVDLNTVLGMVDLVGATNLRVMEMLDSAHTTTFGHPVPTSVPTTPKPGKSILVSGHDLHDLETILKQCEGTDVNVYTHGEMLPAHAYPGLKKYKSLAGHYGGPWQLQKFEFAQFPGAIVMTSNCLIEPMKSYKNRIFTRAVTGWPGVPHIENSDYSAVIAKAKECDGFEEEDIKQAKPLLTGFARNTVMSVADKVLGAVKSGAIKHFFVIGGCDGSEAERSYFTDLAKSTPKDSVILTLGCGKYRFNREDLGEIGGIPRLLDLGQCNDAYSGIQIAVALAKALNTDVNSLPLSFAVSWFEQKAVAVLLTLLHLNIQNIRLGTHLPAFITPTVLNVLIDKYKIKQANSKDVAGDLKNMLANN